MTISPWSNSSDVSGKRKSGVSFPCARPCRAHCGLFLSCLVALGSSPSSARGCYLWLWWALWDTCMALTVVGRRLRPSAICPRSGDIVAAVVLVQLVRRVPFVYLDPLAAVTNWVGGLQE